MPTEPSEITTRPPLADITDAMVQPPSRVYIGVDDRLYIRSRKSLAAVTLQIAGRLLTAEGVIVPFNFEHVPLTTRAVSLEAFQLAEGYILSVVVFPSVGAPLRGQTFVELGLLRGRAVGAAVVDVLARDYVAEAEPIAFPGAPVRSSIDGKGVLITNTAADPAAGVEIDLPIPTDARFKLISFNAILVTDATAANRQVSFTLDDGTTVYGQFHINTSIVASQTVAIGFAPGVLRGGTSTIAMSTPSPTPTLLAAGHHIRTVVDNLQAGDNWGAPTILSEEWIQD